ncbi:MAG: hypothetical protein SCARUB_01534 [Candidatus Scalindua rubra]|uniref:Uncharacterized protein n=1 Tax=Candidatus Scalindua rubra TaxID=1872076 RepID=A0A1E3XEI3_9BACT|nr:MAG: hypothetical protein SCARUB_01534 [Candidatus Scalindua rubra]
MIITYSNNKVPVRLTIERWNHIILTSYFTNRPTERRETSKIVNVHIIPEMAGIISTTYFMGIKVK